MRILLFQKQRRAIAMIELIFAIVVMGIALMSAPMLIERATKSSYVALQQESITAGATQLAMIMTRAWDHNDVNTTDYVPVLTTQSGMAATAAIPNCANITPPGVTNINGRYCQDIAGATPFYPASPIALDSGYQDIDDFNGVSSEVTLYASESSTSDYIDKNITILSNVYYGVDTPKKNNGTDSGGFKKSTTFSNPFRTSSAVTTHIKLITITLTSNNPISELSDKNIFLSAFMCNIGAPRELVSNKGSL